MSAAQEFLERDGHRIGLRVHPAQVDPVPAAGVPVLVFWPAMGVPASYYGRWADQLAAQGIEVVVVDLRGTGSSSPVPSRRVRFGFANLVDDVGHVLDTVRERVDGRMVVAGGHSLGGQVAVLHEATRGGGRRTDGLLLVAVGLPYFRVYPRGGVRALALTQGINLASSVLGYWPGWAFGGRQARGVIRDWAYTARHGRYPRLRGGYVDLAAVDVPVLAVTVSTDQFTPPSTTHHLTGMLTSADVRTHHYTADEAGAPLDHFRWARAGQPLASRVRTFVDGLRPS